MTATTDRVTIDDLRRDARPITDPMERRLWLAGLLTDCMAGHHCERERIMWGEGEIDERGDRVCDVWAHPPTDDDTTADLAGWSVALWSRGTSDRLVVDVAAELLGVDPLDVEDVFGSNTRYEDTACATLLAAAVQ